MGRFADHLSTSAIGSGHPHFRAQPMARFAVRNLRRFDASCPGAENLQAGFDIGRVRSLDRLLDGIVYCVGPERGGPLCGHNAMSKFADPPAWNWQDISAS
jgi:hypothetical protein